MRIQQIPTVGTLARQLVTQAVGGHSTGYLCQGLLLAPDVDFSMQPLDGQVSGYIPVGFGVCRKREARRKEV